LSALSQGTLISPISGMAIGNEHLPVDAVFDDLNWQRWQPLGSGIVLCFGFTHHKKDIGK
jgi:hypothetical protein